MPEWNPRANAIFLQAIEITSPDERWAFLDDQCADDTALRAEVQSLLAASATAGNFLESPVVAVESKLRQGLAPTADMSSTHERPGTLVGRYKLRELIGEGGMGSVWIAEQTEPVRRKVALKLVKPGMDTKEVLSRFEVERQALALMDHPNIAKVHDGGVTSTGRPFFVMEYVKGIPLTQYCDDARLTVKQRLELFVQICQAVQHAHQKGIIHRDLKPSNILVCLYDGRPIPKIIDFGLAKAMHQPLTENTLYTAHGMMVGTPLYMSPEQAEFNNLDVDTRTDIYSLGVILYELLTGTTPLERKRFKDAALQEILRLIKEEDPQKPSTKISGSVTLPTIAAQRNLDPAQLSRVVRGDLDWIAMKSLEKDRSWRYESASGLARDVQRYLDDEPVEACPPSLGYKLRKLARRNKRALATAGLLGVVILGALAVVAGSIGWAVRDRQNRQAVVERQVNAALDEFAVAIKENQIGDARTALKQAEAFQAGSDVRGVASDRVEQCKTDLKLIERLEEIQLDRAGVETDAVGRATIVAAYRRALEDYGLPLDALEPALAAQHIRESAVKDSLLAALDDWAISLPTPVAVRDAGDRGPSRGELHALASLADNDAWRNRLREALQNKELSQLKQLAQDGNWKQQRPLTTVLLADQLVELGDLSTAHALLTTAVEQHPKDFCLNQALGFVSVKMSSEDMTSLGSLSCLQACRERAPTNWAIRAALGWAYFLGNDVPAAEKELREAIRLRRDYATAHFHLAECLEYRGNFDEAQQEYQRAMRFDPRAYEPCRKLADLLYQHHKFSEIEKVFREAIKANPKSSPAHFYLGEFLTYQVKPREAESAYDQAARLDPAAFAEHRKTQTVREGYTSDSAFASAADQLEELDRMAQLCVTNALSAPEDSGDAMRAAVLLLYLGKHKWYETLCRQMLDDFGDSEVAIDAHRTSLTCLLSSSPVGNGARLEQLAVRATAKGGTGKHAALLYGRGRGLAAYRAGRWEDAIKWCAESRASGQGLTVSVSVDTQDMVIEAMAHHQLGKAAEARRLYDEAVGLIRERFPEVPAHLGDDWFDWVLYQILRQEAAALLAINPVDDAAANAHLALAQRHLTQGRWAQGAHHLAIVIEARPQDHLLAMQAAVLQLFRRDQRGYDRVCQLMLHRYGDTQDPVEADRTAKACLLSNPPLGELPQLVKLAEKAASDPQSAFFRYFALVRALAAYRQGNWEECLTWCHEGQHPAVPPKQFFFQEPSLVAHNYVVQAMAQFRAGKLELANASLLEAQKIISETYPEAPFKLTNRWADWMLYDILRREAEQLIQPSPVEAATTYD